MSETKFWSCKHIGEFNGKWSIFNPIFSQTGWVEIPDDWDICPVKDCGARRPEKKKSLAERLQRVPNANINCIEYYEALAEASFKFFEEVIDSLSWRITDYGRKDLVIEELKQKLRERV